MTRRRPALIRGRLFFTVRHAIHSAMHPTQRQHNTPLSGAVLERMTMVQITDGDATATDNVHPFPGAGTEPPPLSKRHRRDRTGAARQAKFRSKNKGDRYERPPADASPPPPADALPIAPTVTQSHVEVVTPPPSATAPR